MDDLTKIVYDWAGDSVKNRWALIAELTDTGVALGELHRRERAREKIVGDCKELAMEGPYLYTELAGKFGLNPFFPKELTQGQRADRMDQFSRKIYPIWAKIVSKAVKENNSRWEQRTLDGNEPDYIHELSILHDCDMAIYQSGHRVDRSMSMSPEEFKKKAVLSSMVREVEQ